MSTYLSISEQVLQLIDTYLESEELKPHQKAANAAFRASAAADDLSDQIKIGKADVAKSGEARDLHKKAHDLHVDAAKTLMKAGQAGTAASHKDLAQQHAQKAAHHHSLHVAKGGEPAKAVGESVSWMRGQRSLMGMDERATLQESNVSRDHSAFERLTGSTRDQQRHWMGLGEGMPSLAEARTLPKKSKLPPGLAAALAKKHKKTEGDLNPGAKKVEPAVSQASKNTLATLAAKRGPTDLPSAPRKKAAMSTLAKLKAKYGEQIEWDIEVE